MHNLIVVLLLAGLSRSQLEYLAHAKDAVKVSRRDIAAVISQVTCDDQLAIGFVINWPISDDMHVLVSHRVSVEAPQYPVPWSSLAEWESQFLLRAVLEECIATLLKVSFDTHTIK